MRKRKPDWLLVIVGTLIGAAAGLFLVLMEYPFHVYMAYSVPAIGDAVLYVDLLGSHWYTRSAPRPDDLRVEMFIWFVAPLVVMTVIGAVCGWVGSILLNRRGPAQKQPSATL